MTFDVVLPDLGEETTEAATIAIWYIGVGQSIVEGDDLVELTTDKAAFTLPSPKSGRVIEHKAPEGAEVRTGDVLCILELG